MAQDAHTTQDHTQNRQDARQQVITVRDLQKEFRGTRAVDGVSFDVWPGRVTGFLGPNGAGKTTTLRMILGLIRPTGGSALLWGSPYAGLAAPTRRIGVGLDGGAFVGRRTDGAICAATHRPPAAVPNGSTGCWRTWACRVRRTGRSPGTRRA
ncbi:hypothetical protein SBADM41S_06234 [Streptomyces badius]